MHDTHHNEPATAALKPLLDRLVGLYEDFQQQADLRLAEFQQYQPGEQQLLPSAVNLAHYLALRSFDLRELQQQLAAFGLSSLGRAEASIVDSMNRVISLLCRILDEPLPESLDLKEVISAEAGAQLLRRNTDDLLGSRPPGRAVRIMVTLPSEAASDFALVKGLLETGMNCARINCAHDDGSSWLRMIENVRIAEQQTDNSCRIMMDLAGQKIRTGPIEAGPAVAHLKAKRDDYGSVIKPACLEIVKHSRFPGDSSRGCFRIGIDDDIQADLIPGDWLNMIDNRGKHRQFEVIGRNEDDVVLIRCWKSVYLTSKSRFQLRRKGISKTAQQHLEIAISDFQAAPAKIRVFKNDQLLLTGSTHAGRAALREADGTLLHAARIGISHDEILQQLKPGVAVWIDDGKIGARVEALTEQGVVLRITHARANGTLVRSDKGVNFPDTELNLPALTAKDLQDLDFICQHADIIGYSFVQSKTDMDCLLQELQQRNSCQLPIIAKIETGKAVRHLPEIIISALGYSPLGVMIARGDLAVELGSVRLAEMQEEILWLCEAAHVPVIWATQVLETLAKSGIHSRPEISDAAMSVRAECVMLNKGPYITDAVTVLNDILVRMQEHQHKKSSRLRALQQWPLSHRQAESTSHSMQSPVKPEAAVS